MQRDINDVMLKCDVLSNGSKYEYYTRITEVTINGIDTRLECIVYADLFGMHFSISTVTDAYQLLLVGIDESVLDNSRIVSTDLASMYVLFCKIINSRGMHNKVIFDGIMQRVVIDGIIDTAITETLFNNGEVQ